MPDKTISQYEKQKLSRIQVLVVISSRQASELIKYLFENIGFKSIHIAYTAVDAIALLKIVRVQIIVADAELELTGQTVASPNEAEKPVIDLLGIKFVQRLRYSASSPAAYTPILILIDSPNSKTILSARDAGVNEIVVKPIEARPFCERIINLVDNPRIHVTSDNYKGPCRRRKDIGPPVGMSERRKREIRLITCNEIRGAKK
jgi:two-component system chemotaxis response regulator CheY